MDDAGARAVLTTVVQEALALLSSKRYDRVEWMLAYGLELITEEYDGEAERSDSDGCPGDPSPGSR